MSVPAVEAVKKSKTAWGAHLTLLITVTIWACTFVNIKVVLQQIPPNTVAFLRFLIAAVILGLFSWLTHQPQIKKADLRWVALSGLTGVALYNFLQNQGLKYAGVTDAAILASTAPVFMAIMAVLILKENITKQQIFGIVIAFAGSALVATNGNLDSSTLDLTRLYGDFLILLTGICWGLYNIGLRKLLDSYPAVTVITYSSVAGTLFLLPTVFFDPPFQLADVNFWGWFHVFFLGIFASALAYLLWNKALTQVKTVQAGAYIYLIPVISALCALIFLQEVPTLYTFVGGAAALLGTYFAGK